MKMAARVRDDIGRTEGLSATRAPGKAQDYALMQSDFHNVWTFPAGSFSFHGFLA
jgi:hypothetical protein